MTLKLLFYFTYRHKTIATEGSQGVQGGVTGSQGHSLTKSNHDTLDLRKPNILSCVLKVIVERVHRLTISSPIGSTVKNKYSVCRLNSIESHPLVGCGEVDHPAVLVTVVWNSVLVVFVDEGQGPEDPRCRT